MVDIVLWLPTLVWGAIFMWSYHREPRQFRNAFFFLLLCLFAFWGMSIQFNMPWLFGLGILAIPFGTIALVVFLLANAVVVIRREGFSLSHALPGLMALAIVAVCLAGPLLVLWWRMR